MRAVTGEVTRMVMGEATRKPSRNEGGKIRERGRERETEAITIIRTSWS